jgi:hypothetical protein
MRTKETIDLMYNIFNQPITAGNDPQYKRPILSKGSTNAKTAKNDLKTFILYLAPYKQNSKGINLCPKASAGCAAACLFTAGRGKMSPVKKARINKTEYFLSNKRQFIIQLSIEIVKAYNKAKKGNYKIAFRLNGTSDLDFIYMLKKYSNLDITSLSDHAVFYDYTAILGKAQKYIAHPNYHVTFSRKEDNQLETARAIDHGINTAVVFSNALPKTYLGAVVIDADQRDDLMINHKGIILGLRAKGDAKKDQSGFVVQTDDNGNLI